MSVGLLAACSISGDRGASTVAELGPSAPELAAATVPDLPTAKPDPNTSWLAARSELDDFGQRMEERVENAVSDCMARLGFEYEPVVSSLPGSPAQVWFGDFDSDVEWAQHHGYSSPALVEALDEPQEREVADQNFMVALMGQSDEMTEVTSPLTSSPTLSFQKSGGCMAEADTAVFGSVERGEQYTVAYQVADSLLYELLFNADADPRLVEPLDAWRTCVTDQGYPTSGSPADLARETTADRYAADEITAEVPPQEILVAVADHTCRAKVGLGTAYEQVLDSYLEPQLDILNTQMETLRQLSIPPRDG